MTKIKDGDHFTIEKDEDYLRLASRIQETVSSDGGEYTTNGFPSDEERKALSLRAQADAEGTALNAVLFKENEGLRIHRIH